MSLQETIRSDMKAALKERDEVRLTTLRGLISAFTNELVAQKRKPTEALEDKEALAVVKRAVKQRKDSIEQFRAGGREDLATAEETEMAILEAYLPESASKEEIERVARAKKEELGVEDKAKMGILVGAIMKEFAGNADGADVKEVVEALF